MKKIASLLLCMVLLLSVCCVNASAAEDTCIGAGVTVAEDGTVTVAVSAKAAAANARLTVGFDADRLTYTACETAFDVHTVKKESGKVTIGELADIKGDIKAGEVHIYGHVDGNVNSGRCHLNERAVVNGDITTSVLSMVEGARLSGRAQIG